MKASKGGGSNGKAKGLVKHPVMTQISLSDLKDYQKEMNAFNLKMKLLDKDQQKQAKTARGRDWRGGYLMAMVILNANNESIRVLQKERDHWFTQWEQRGELLNNAQLMVDMQKGLSEKGMTRENALKHEHQAEVKKLLEVLTLLKQYPDKLTELLKALTPAVEIVQAMEKIFMDIRDRKKT